MSIHDYLIDHRGLDWPSLFAEWTWLVPTQFAVWLMNRFGDLFLVFDDGSVHMLDVGGGSLEQVANTRAEADRDDHPGFPIQRMHLTLCPDLNQRNGSSEIFNEIAIFLCQTHLTGMRPRPNC